MLTVLHVFYITTDFAGRRCPKDHRIRNSCIRVLAEFCQVLPIVAVSSFQYSGFLFTHSEVDRIIEVAKC
jgi:hypothetical protein